MGVVATARAQWPGRSGQGAGGGGRVGRSGVAGWRGSVTNRTIPGLAPSHVVPPGRPWAYFLGNSKPIISVGVGVWAEE